MPTLRDVAVGAEASGAAALIVGDGPLGDPVVLAAGLASWVHRALLGVRTSLTSGRHPAVLARELTSLDLVCGARALLCVVPPFDDHDAVAEAIALCRALWREGVADGGERFPVARAVNRPRPASDHSPLVALDLTAGADASPVLLGVADLILRPTPDRTLCRMERA